MYTSEAKSLSSQPSENVYSVEYVSTAADSIWRRAVHIFTVSSAIQQNKWQIFFPERVIWQIDIADMEERRQFIASGIDTYLYIKNAYKQ